MNANYLKFGRMRAPRVTSIRLVLLAPVLLVNRLSSEAFYSEPHVFWSLDAGDGRIGRVANRGSRERPAFSVSLLAWRIRRLSIAITSARLLRTGVIRTALSIWYLRPPIKSIRGFDLYSIFGCSPRRIGNSMVIDRDISSVSRLSKGLFGE
jgi:hypothetical protein